MPSESYNVSLRSAYDKPRTKRAKYSITSLYNFLLKHTRKDRKDVVISGEVNAYIWARSITKPPRSVAISIKQDNNKVYVFLKDSKEFKEFKNKGKEKEVKPKKEEKAKEIPKDEVKAVDQTSKANPTEEAVKPKPEKKTGKLRPMEDHKKQKAETKWD